MALLLALNLLAFLLALMFGAGVSIAVRRLRRPPMPVPPEGARLRIRSDLTVYRSRFLGADRTGWRFAAPLQRDVYVPLRVGESLVIEAESDHERLLFRSTLISRDAETGMMVAQVPQHVFRAAPRVL